MIARTRAKKNLSKKNIYIYTRLDLENKAKQRNMKQRQNRFKLLWFSALICSNTPSIMTDMWF